MQRLETNRLILRDIILDDANDMFEYASLDDVGPNTGWKVHKTLQETKIIITSLAASNQVWAIEYISNHKMIGSVGMHSTSDSEFPILGIVVSPFYQHKGLAKEACFAVLEHTFETTSTQFISAFVYDYNTPSIKLLSYLGFKNTKNDKILCLEGTYETIQLELLLSKKDFFKIKNV